MPEICRFYGIIIRFYYREHPPRHFHAIYGEHEALIEIETGDVHEGRLPRTAYDLVQYLAPDSSAGASRQLGTRSPAAAVIANSAVGMILLIRVIGVFRGSTSFPSIRDIRVIRLSRHTLVRRRMVLPRFPSSRSTKIDSINR